MIKVVGLEEASRICNISQSNFMHHVKMGRIQYYHKALNKRDSHGFLLSEVIKFKSEYKFNKKGQGKKKITSNFPITAINKNSETYREIFIKDMCVLINGNKVHIYKDELYLQGPPGDPEFIIEFNGKDIKFIPVNAKIDEEHNAL